MSNSLSFFQRRAPTASEPKPNAAPEPKPAPPQAAPAAGQGNPPPLLPTMRRRPTPTTPPAAAPTAPAPQLTHRPFLPDADPVQDKSQLTFTRKYEGTRPDLGTWKYYKDEMPPKECTLVLFTEEYFGQNVKNIDVSLGFACDLHDHILADLKMFGKEGLRFRFWQFVPLPPSLSEKMAYVGESFPSLIHK